MSKVETDDRYIATALDVLEQLHGDREESEE